VNVTECGKQAILQLAGGDLRRVLNLLQSTQMAYPDSVNEETVYLTAGAAIPSVINQMLQSLLNDTFDNAYKHILKAITDFGYALCDILTEITRLLNGIVLPDAAISYLMDKLSDIEFRLSQGASEKLQLGSFVGAFTVVRTMLSPP